MEEFSNYVYFLNMFFFFIFFFTKLPFSVHLKNCSEWGIGDKKGGVYVYFN